MKLNRFLFLVSLIILHPGASQANQFSQNTVNQYINFIRNNYIEDISKWMLEHDRESIFRLCNLGRKINRDGYSFYDFQEMVPILPNISLPSDVKARMQRAQNYAMSFTCPDVR